MPTSPEYDCDVIVAGGGPAGSTAASALARDGHTVELFERDRFPRFHIGESLLASVNPVLEAIGARDLVRQAGFPQKWGATFLLADGTGERFADFGEAPGVPSPQTWQVQRARFDELLLRHAAASGARVHEGHRVLDVTFDDEGVTVAVQATGDEAPVRHVRARVVIDCSGRGALLSRKFGLRIDEPHLTNIAVFSHYSGVPRLAGRRAGDIRIISRYDLGWFWMIPISAELMSVGVVLPMAVYQAMRVPDHEAVLDRAIAETPAVAALLAEARREWPVRVERDFSFGSRTYAGDHWLLAGDAGSFLDPVFSTGVATALESSLEAARAVSAALRAGDTSSRRFSAFSARQRRRYRWFRRFVIGFYTAEFRDLFYNEDPPTHIFRALVSTFAGSWRPKVATRFWIELFFVLARLQRRLHFATSFVPKRPPSMAQGFGTE